MKANTPGWGPSIVPQTKRVQFGGAEMIEEKEGQYSMMEFAMKYFRGQDEPDLKRGGSILRREAVKKEVEEAWTWKALADLVKFTKQPITNSLLNFNDRQLSKLSVDCFRGRLE